MTEIRPLHGADLASALPALADLLCACVDDGASIGFLRPLDKQMARSFWDDVAGASARAGRLVFGAFREGRLEGSVQLIPIHIPNQPHRAEIAKLIVHPQARRRGHARALMLAAEAAARNSGRSLLTLDTAGAAASALYESLGYIRCGGIPGFALDADGQPEPNIFYYKSL